MAESALKPGDLAKSTKSPRISSAAADTSPSVVFASGEASPLLSQHSTSSDESPNTKRRRHQKMALFAACFIPFGAYYAKQSLPPLRPLFTKSGMFIDAKGHERGAILFTTLALIGHGIFAASVGHIASLNNQMTTAVTGRVIFGLGSGGAGVVQGAIVGHHFEEDLTFAVGMSESLHYLGKWLGKATPVLIANEFDGNFVAALWAGCFFLLMSCMIAIGYVLQEELHKPFTFALGASGKGSRRHHMSISTVDSSNPNLVVNEESYTIFSSSSIFSLPRSFWLIGGLHMLFSNTANLFAGFSTSYMVETFNLTPERAALYASIDAFLPIFVSPLVGRYVDKFGGRLYVCLAAALLDCLSFGILALFGPSLPYGPLLPIILISFSTCTTPMLVKSCIPLVVPREVLGTAFSCYLVFESLGASVGHVGLGYIRDLSTDYTADLCVILGIAFIAVFATMIVMWYDATRLNNLLNNPASSRFDL